MTLEERFKKFIENAKIVHKNENLDFSKVDYKNSKEKIIIIDHDLDENGNEYGEFKITPTNLLKGRSHPRKKGKKISEKKKLTTEEIIKRFKEVHKNENLDYSKVEYKGMDNDVIIICNELDENGIPYGEFKQTPRIHLKGCTHKQLSIDKNKIKKRKDTSYCIERLKMIHGDKYDYSKVDYKYNDIKICVICPKHGEFWMTPENLYYGKGCPKCGNHLSNKEDEIYDKIRKHFNCVKNTRNILNGKEIDIFIPSKNIGIEYNGLRWHSEWFGGKSMSYHLNKLNECNEKNIKLIHIFEDEYIEHKEIVLNKLFHILNICKPSNKIMARKCDIVEIDKCTAEIFLNQYHIQGFASSTVYLGCFYESNLIGVMTFKKECKDGYWELNRFASDYNYICQGVGGKLFKYFIKKYNPIEVKSFADRRWTIDKDNNLYTKLGFTLEKVLKPDYKYYNPKVDKYKRFHIFNFRKEILHKKYGFDMSMTETEMVKELGYDKIWDCGLFKYVWKK